ncbi:MAG TPA: L-type lectin-domain containing protein, partial [Verrucomicrobiae bacterium]
MKTLFSRPSPAITNNEHCLSCFPKMPCGYAYALLASLAVLSSSEFLRAADTLIPVGATWRYLDNGSDPGTAWRGTNFNDSTWASGPAELGYGDGGEATVVNGGPSGSRIPTTFFRRTFVVANRPALTNLAVRLVRDDGGIVYLNGVEVFRSNMPEGATAFNSWAALGIGGSDESTFFSTAVPPALLVSGTNVVAVEIHQSDPGSTDVSFNLELIANTPLGNQPPVPNVSISPSGQIIGTNQAFLITVTASDPESSVPRMDVLQDDSTIQIFLTNSAALSWFNQTVGIHDYTVRAVDATGLSGFSAPARVWMVPSGSETQSTFFPNFPSANGLVLQGDATTTSNVLHLMRPNGSGGGAAWMSAQRSVAGGFISEFRFRIVSRVGGGADGFAFAIAGTPQPVFGSSGLSYSGITNSLAVEFDTWQNSSDGDPNDHHIAVHSRGALGNSQSETASLGLFTPADFSDGLVHQVRISYVPGAFLVFLDNFSTPVLNLNLDLSTLLALPGGKAWIGLMAGSGSSTETHDISTWSYAGFANAAPIVALASPAQA